MEVVNSLYILGLDFCWHSQLGKLINANNCGQACDIEVYSAPYAKAVQLTTKS